MMNAEPVCGWTLEEAARKRGALRIAGVDEVGRGPLFGPVVAAAVILPKGCNLPGLNDSKKLKARKRLELEPEIKANAVAWAIAEVDAETIDRINIRQASLLAMRRAVEQLALGPDFLLIDGRDTITWSGPQQAVIKGDATSFSIAAASVLAKVYRDRLIVELDQQYPGYGLARHKGYGCPEHMAALQRLGPTPLHRKTFSGVGQGVLRFDASQTAADDPALDEDLADSINDELDEETAAEIAEAEAERPLRFACPCCGYLTLEAEPPGTYAHCEVCWWEDDPIQFADPDYEGGGNAPSLHQARRLFREIGVSDAQFKGDGRAPRPEEFPGKLF
jgi:ribonuclease HII